MSNVLVGILVAVSLIVTICTSISLSVTNSWAGNYLVVIIAGSVAIIATSILLVLMHYQNLNRDLENADTANTEFRDLGLDN